MKAASKLTAAENVVMTDIFAMVLELNRGEQMMEDEDQISESCKKAWK